MAGQHGKILLCVLAFTAYSLASERNEISAPELANLMAARFPLLAALMGRTPYSSAYPVPIYVPVTIVHEPSYDGFLEKFFCKHKHHKGKEEVSEWDQKEEENDDDDESDHDEEEEYSDEPPPLQPAYPLPPPPPYHPPGHKPKPKPTTTTSKPVKTTTKPVKTTTKKPTTMKKPPKTTMKTTTTTTTTTPCPAHHPDDYEDHEDHHHHEPHPVAEEYPSYPSHPPGYPVIPYPQPTTTTTTTAKPKPTRPVWWSIFTTPKPKSAKSPLNNLRRIDQPEAILYEAVPVEMEKSKGEEELVKSEDYIETLTLEDTTPLED